MQRYIVNLRLIIFLSILAILPFVSTQTANAQSPYLTFAYNSNFQWVDPAGQNQVAFNLNEPSVQVKFTLYEVSSADFVAYQAAHQPYERVEFDTTGLTEADTWDQIYNDSAEILFEKVVTTSLPSVGSGIYLLDTFSTGGPMIAPEEPVRVPEQRGSTTQTFVVISEQMLVTKRGNNGQLVVWASHTQSKTPTPNMDVKVYDSEGVVIASGSTDSQGIVELNMGDNEPVMVLGEIGDQITAAGFNYQWQSPGNYGYWNPNFGTDYRAFVYTDRPIYRPGHTIHFSAILRYNRSEGYQPVSDTEKIAATLHDSRGNVVDTLELTANDFGIVDGSFELADQPPMGNYSLRVKIGEETFYQQLMVESYRKPEYEVEVTTPENYAVAGDDIPITVDANYFFGQPVADAAVTLKVYQEYYYFYNYYGWSPMLNFADDFVIAPPFPFPNGEPVEVYEGRTDSEGRWTHIYSPETTERYNQRYRFEAEVTDARELPVQGENSVQVFWNTFILSMNTAKYGYEIDEEVAVVLQATGHDNQPVAGQKVEVFIERTYPEQETMEKQLVTTDAEGNAEALFAGLPQGWYRIRAVSEDGRGRKIDISRYLWIYDSMSNRWWFTSHNELFISTDQDDYVPGDVAELLIESHITGTALLTLEGQGVRHEMVIPIDGPVTTVEIPIESTYAPNIFASVHIAKLAGEYDNTIYTEGHLIKATTELIVEPLEKKLNIEISADAEQYLPGQEAVLTLKVTDENGDPVRANVGLALVDEAIFALQEDLSADLFATFYNRQYNRVVSHDSLGNSREFYLRFTAEAAIDNAVEDGPAPAPDGVKNHSNAPRQEFADTAYWNPTIVTDDNGMATLNVPLPDNLTTWRITARAVTKDTKLGEAEDEILVTKEVIARPGLPRFSILGDRFNVSLVGQNFSGSAASGEATLASDHLFLLDEATQTVSIPDKGTDVAEWTVVASHIGEGLVTSTLDLQTGLDQVILPFQTDAFAVPERWSASGQVESEIQETFKIPFNAINEASSVEVRLASSLALSILDGLDDLINYPYGCVEQTMSRLLPSAVAAQAYKNLGIPNPKADELPKIIKQGLQRIYGFQHDAGSWGWFYDDDGGLYMTSYVLFGLVMAEKSGFPVDEGVMGRGFAYLNTVLPEADDAGTIAYALYVKSVAGRGDLEAAQKLAALPEKLDPFGLAVLAMALQIEGDRTGAEGLVNNLEEMVEEDSNFAFWPLEYGEWNHRHWTMMSSAEKNTAAAIQALVSLNPDSPLLSKAIRWLLAQRRGAGWRNTQATAFAVLGLADYIQVSGELDSDYTYKVLLNDDELAQGTVTPATVTDPIEPIQIPGSLLETGENRLTIQRVGDTGQLYYTVLVRQALFYDGFKEVSSIDRGLALRRSYKLVEGEPSRDGSYTIGDVVEVQLSLTADQDMEHVLIEDSLPAGFEAMNERLNTVAYNGGRFFSFWRGWGYNYKNIYDNKVSFFATYVGAGNRVYTYLMRAATPGEFSALPAQAYPMYVDEKWGRSGSDRVIIEPESLTERPSLLADFDRDCLVSEFDSRQVAGAWGTSNADRDVITSVDSAVDLQDVAVTVARTGSDCANNDEPLPGVRDEDADFSVVVRDPTSGTVSAARRADVDMVAVDLYLDQGSTSVDGFSLDLTFDPAKLELIDVEWVDPLASTIELGPHIDNDSGRVRFGSVDIAEESQNMVQASGVDQEAGTLLATMHFQRTDGADDDLELTVAEIAAVDTEGNLLNSEATIAPQEPAQIMGDVNCDGTIDAVDGLFIMRYDVALIGHSDSCTLGEGEMYLGNCDTNQDAACNVVDALMLLRCELGFTNIFCPE